MPSPGEQHEAVPWLAACRMVAELGGVRSSVAAPVGLPLVPLASVRLSLLDRLLRGRRVIQICGGFYARSPRCSVVGPARRPLKRCKLRLYRRAGARVFRDREAFAQCGDPRASRVLRRRGSLAFHGFDGGVQNPEAKRFKIRHAEISHERFQNSSGRGPSADWDAHLIGPEPESRRHLAARLACSFRSGPIVAQTSLRALPAAIDALPPEAPQTRVIAGVSSPRVVPRRDRRRCLSRRRSRFESGWAYSGSPASSKVLVSRMAWDEWAERHVN